MAWWWEKIDIILMQQKVMADDLDRMGIQLAKVGLDTAEILAIAREAEAAAQRATRVQVSLGKPTDKRTK